MPAQSLHRHSVPFVIPAYAGIQSIKQLLIRNISLTGFRVKPGMAVGASANY